MSISNAAYRQLLSEYEEKQLAAKRGRRLRVQKIEAEIPELSGLNSQLTEVSARLAVMRVKGNSESRAELERSRAALIEQRNMLMERAGYSVRDLEPVYECEACSDTGYVNGEMCSCMRARITDILYDQSNIKEILKKENFRNYTLRYYSNDPVSPDSDETPLSAANRAARTAWEFVQNFDNTSDNLFICGDVGTGKTFLSNCIAAELLDRGCYVIYLSAVKLFGMLADSTFGGGKKDGKTVEDLYGCDLLIIDDLGTEYTNSFIQSAFFNCINERLLRKKHTVISTNLSMEMIRENYSERIFSRIMEKYTLIRLLGGDIRIIRKMEE
ncbi:MAG: ATP-binding protein [Parasporobacterium sp.]|nr:ATP-binding protein [Parasporobacterium sp.]